MTDSKSSILKDCLYQHITVSVKETEVWDYESLVGSQTQGEEEKIVEEPRKLKRKRK